MTDKSNLDKIHQAEQLLARLEKIPVDSKWSHRASGVRASLAKHLSSMSDEPNPDPFEGLESLMQTGYRILEKAAREIPE